MSRASIRTTFDPFICTSRARYGSGSTGYLRKGSVCTIQEGSEMSFDSSEDIIPLEEDPSRINYYELGSIPSTSTYSSPDQYGVPLTEQQVTVDFTPVRGIDDDEKLLKKCNKFWEFIEKNPKLKKFCATPTQSITVDEEEQSLESSYDEQQAMNWMKENEKTLADSFKTINIQKRCEPIPGEYKFGPEPRKRGRTSLLDRSWLRKCESLVGRRCLTDNTERVIEGFITPDPSSGEVLKLCQEMREWDLTHPETMQPPGHPPALAHAVLRRKHLN